MLETLPPILLAEASALVGVYWISLIVGGGLLAMSLIGAGDSDADVDVDFGGDMSLDMDLSLDTDISMDADVGVDVDMAVDADATMHADTDGVITEAASLATWFSLRFLIYFAASFGLVGVVLSYTTQLGSLGALAISLGSGVVAGQAVHQLFRKLLRDSGNSVLHKRDFLDKPARVTVGIEKSRTGEVVLRLTQGDRFVRARARHADRVFARGDQVAVVGYVGGVAEVVSKEEYEFLVDKH